MAVGAPVKEETEGVSEDGREGAVDALCGWRWKMAEARQRDLDDGVDGKEGLLHFEEKEQWQR